LALDRQSIEKKDFPIGRRGYEPEAVDAHLAVLAKEFDALQRQSDRRSGDSLANAASSHVRAIVEAAEQTAAEIEREAAAEASQLRAEASVEAERVRDEAATRSYEHVARVHESTAQMLQRIDAMEGELTTLFESLRTGANRLHADLSLLQGNAGDLSGAMGREQPLAAVPPVPSGRYTPPGVEETLAEPLDEEDWREEVTVSEREDAERELEEEDEEEFEPRSYEKPPVIPVPEPTFSQPAGAAPPSGGGTGDVEGARLVALNMALNGQPRQEAERYLAENFDLPDRDALLDEVYEAVGG
jgi:hypothetical protein